ncbi:hypothetical protein ACFOQM_02825 [Paenibacillus sp. GCM10012307]|uniref:Right handed beta helix domain-containing protein n=1 Tax=Paenibacillus roseus TaxID=2798579 RepID=A0A934MJT2_9BACL|nr:hypothetical protein [Paenibacillus roseus]MBJ6360250.1 hypothetical protein [Paenibacillus roseus]
MVNISDFPRIVPEADDTLRIQRAADNAIGKTLLIPYNVSDYVISQSIRIDPTTKVAGTSRSVKIRNTNDNVYAFVIQPAIGSNNVNQAEGFEHLYIRSKFGIKYNREGDYSSVWSQQPSLFNVFIRNCYFEGQYSSAVDPNYNTDVVPGLNELKEYGIAVWGAKIFNLSIRDNFISNFGIPLYLEGCDHTEINNNRITLNAISVYLTTKRGGGQNYGSQCSINHNEIVGNSRRGQILIPDGDAHTISDNFFEADKSACEFLRIFGDFSNLITGNRFNVTKMGDVAPTTPIITIDVGYGSVVSHNRCNLKYAEFLIDIKTSRYKTYRGNLHLEPKYFILWKDNSSTFPVPNHPLVRTKEIDPLVFNSKNPRFLNNQIALGEFPWEPSTVSSNWAIKTNIEVPFRSNLAVDIIMDQLSPSNNHYIVLVRGRKVSKEGLCEIRADNDKGKLLYSQRFAFADTDKLSSHSIDLQATQGITKLFFRFIVNDGTAETNQIEEIILRPTSN